MAVGAAVVVEEEVLHADGDVMAEPLLDVRRLVLEDGHDRELEAGRVDERCARRPGAAARPDARPPATADEHARPVGEPWRQGPPISHTRWTNRSNSRDRRVRLEP